MHDAKKKAEVVEKVKKLLALTREGAGVGPGLVATAAAKAQELIDRYKIDAALLETDEERRERETAVGAHNLYTFDGPRVGSWQLSLVSAIAKLNGVTCWYTSGIKGTDLMAQISGAGTAENVETTRLMVTLVMAEIDRLYHEDAPKGLSQGEAKSWAFSYRNGCVVTIEQRLHEQRRKTERAMTNTASWETLYTKALDTPDLRAHLDREITALKINPARGDELPRWAQEILTEIKKQSTGTALVRVENAITLVRKEYAFAEAWTQANMQLRATGPRPKVGVSDKGEVRDDPFRAGKKAGHRAKLDGHERKRLT